MPYVPHEGSLADRVCAFFRSQPTEELTSADIAAKFDVLVRNVQPGLASCVANQALLRRRDRINEFKTETVYIAGPKLQDTAPVAASADSTGQPAGFKGWLQRKGQASAEGRSKTTPLPPPESLRIEKDVPLPPPPVPKPRRAAYIDVFKGMQPGDSFECPTDAARRLYLSACRFAKPLGFKFVVRSAEKTARIWRTE